MPVTERFCFTCAQCKGDILPGQAYDIRGRKRIHLSPSCNQHIVTLATETDLWDYVRNTKLVEFRQQYTLPTKMPSMSTEYLQALFKRARRETWLRYRRVMIRSYRAMARCGGYTCYRCNNRRHPFWDSRISAGEEYDAEVYVGDSGWETRRFHLNCPEDYPDDYIWLYDDDEDTLEESSGESEEFAEAA